VTTVAVVMACHNRREKTLGALRALAGQRRHDADVTVHLVDDGSTDGTSQAVRAEFPDAEILPGNGGLYWNGGMRVAAAAARRRDPDHYLWLNDDTVLDDAALRVLLDTAALHPGAIVVGSTRDPDTGVPTYGGVHRPFRRPLRFELVPPADEPRECETMNGNCVLIPRAVASVVGNLDSAYTHGMGDYDYGLRARRYGLAVWMAPGTIATCARNPEPVPGERPLRLELARLADVKGLPPRDWLVFSRRWAGPAWPVYWASPYLRRGATLVRARL
jgi:GT2 family glycosyltransferase